MSTQKLLSVKFPIVSLATIALTNIGIGNVLADPLNDALFNTLSNTVITNPTAAQQQQLAEAAFVYGYSLLAEQGTEYQNLAIQNPLNPPGSPLAIVNSQFNLNTRLSTSADTTFVRPNNDTLYGNGFLNLSQGPVTVTIPAVPSSIFFSIQLQDAYLNTFGYIGDIGSTQVQQFQIQILTTGTFYLENKRVFLQGH